MTLFSGTNQQMYPCIYEIIQATRFNRKITGQSYIVQLPYQFRAAENTVCWSCLTVLPVKSLQNSTANVRVHASVTLLVLSYARPFLIVFFLEHLETSILHQSLFGRCTISRLSHVHPLTQKHFCKWHHDSEALFSFKLCRCDVLLGKLLRNFFNFMSFKHAPSISKTKFAYLSFTHVQCVQKLHQ